ncbi:phenylpyruvate tautomerase MIF-related protein [Thiohalospira sp.]|uniref:phenylpyruvate tautomerase MIF-related protein n=1 Tax=Thiohalospira sp. TaxID=3080549 RepID=UPI00397F7B37
MPYLAIRTNLALDEATAEELSRRASTTVAGELGKPEGYVMVEITPGVNLRFGGSTEPAAYMELKSLGLPEERTGEFSATLCDLAGEFGIPAERIYIEFAGPDRHLWGFRRTTFAG